MTTTADIRRELRAQLVQAICVAQEVTVPRNDVERMCYALLMNALASLDAESGVEPVHVIRIALHALNEWRALSHRDSAIA